MTALTIPEEPPVDRKVRDAIGSIWTHRDDGWAVLPRGRRYGWHMVFSAGPNVTLIEPEPFPTEPYVWAMGCLWCRVSDGGAPYYVNADGASRTPSDPVPFAGPVVPVTVVPTAALPTLWSALECWLNNQSMFAAADTPRLAGAVISLREQIEALGLDR